MSAMKYTEDSDWDEFGNDLYSIPDQLLVQLINIISEAPPTSNIDEESKIKALIDTPPLDCQQQGSEVLEGAWVDGWGVDVVSVWSGKHLHRAMYVTDARFLDISFSTALQMVIQILTSRESSNLLVFLDLC